MTLNELEKRLNAESAGGRLVVFHDGKKQYITDIGDDGQAFLNELGLMLHNAADHTTEPAPAPKKREKKVVEDVATTSDDVQIEV
jgi:hypothetical protein